MKKTAYDDAFNRYVLKTLCLAKKDYYRKLKIHTSREPCILDSPIQDTNNKIIDLIEKKSSSEIPFPDKIVILNELYEYIENECLLKIINILNKKESFVIKRFYFEEKKIVDIAKELGVSRQYITKIKNSALNKLRTETKKREVT